MPDERLMALKERAAPRLMPTPGVTAVGLGGRMREGRTTGEVVLKVFVERKKPRAELTPGQTLPLTFEGVGVDVSEPGPLTPLTPHADPQPDAEPPPMPGSAGVPPEDFDNDRYRPLPGGMPLRGAVTGSQGATVGCVLRPNPDAAKVYGLTTFHNLRSVSRGVAQVVGEIRVGRPTPKGSRTKCCSHMSGTFAGGGDDAVRDAAVVLLDPGTEWLAEIFELGPIPGTHKITLQEAATLTYPARKQGARARLTGGADEPINTAISEDGVVRDNVIIVTPNPRVPVPATLFWADAGDSGCVVVNDAMDIVGPHIGGSATGNVHKGFETPIDVVLAQVRAHESLPLAVATADRNGVVNVVPGARPMAAPGPQPDELLTRVGADLDRSAAGRRFLTLWLDHQDELLDLVNERRRVTIAWHRGGGPALMQLLMRAADPELRLPDTINSDPPVRKLELISAALHAAASPSPRRALERAREALPEPAGLTYSQIMAFLRRHDA
jgi:hypothetical protein